MRPHDCRQFPAYTGGPGEFYARSTQPAPPPPRATEEPGPPARRPRHFVRCFPAIPALSNLG
ncbi:MAG TPA: hypothetical protein VIF15_20370 [Polyangiaceae bacterium]|jgi:hypothetical protein